MDRTLEDNMVRQFVRQRHTHRPQRGPYPILQAGTETSETDANAVKSDSGCSWQGHSRMVGADVRYERTESRSVVQSLHIPSVIRPVHHAYVAVVR